MTRPTLHVTNWSSRKLHGPGRKWNLMARPRAWEHGHGNVPLLTPSSADLSAVQAGHIDVAEYRRRYLARVEPMVGQGRLSPGRLGARSRGEPVLVSDGDTLCCACSRVAAEREECHRAWAAPLLVRAGWRVVLDGWEVEEVGW